MAVKQNGVLATFTPTVSKYTNLTVPANNNTIAATEYNIYTCPAATLMSGKLIVSNNTGGALNIDVGVVEQTDVIQFDALGNQPGTPDNYGAFSFSSGTPSSYATSIAIEGGGVSGSGFTQGEQVTWTNSNITNPATNNNNHTAYVRYWNSSNSKLWLDRMSHPNALEVPGDTTFTGASSGTTIAAGPTYPGTGGYQGWSGNVRFYDSLNGRLYLQNHEFRNNLDYSVIYDTFSSPNETREENNNNLNRSLGRLYRPVATTQTRFAAAGNTTPVTEFISGNGVELLVSGVSKIHAEQYLVQDKALNDNDIFELNGIVLGTYQSLYVKSTGAVTFTLIGFEEVAEIPS